MKLLLVLAFAIPTLAIAQQRSVLEDRVLNSLRDVRNSINANYQRMTDTELRDADQLLRDVKDLADGRRGRDRDDRDLPRPRPQPVPQRPVPQPRLVVCSQNSAMFQDTFILIKSFAYDGSGLNYTSMSATTYAQNWTNQYPCEFAVDYTESFKKLKEFAYSSTGLNYTTASAIAYATSNINNFCSDAPIAAIFSRHYDFAYSASGLNYTSMSARKYAQPLMEKEVMNCPGRFSIPN